MNVRKEPLVFLGALALVGLLVWPSLTRQKARGTTRQAKPPELVLHPPPDTALALPAARDTGQLARDLFAPPRDTRPLPPLELEPPPLEPLAALRPPPEPGPRPSQFGAFLRADATPHPVPGLFVSAAPEEPDALLGAEEPDTSLLGTLKELGFVGGTLTLEERQAQLESWRKLYDWVQIGEGLPQFGQIRNEDRFGLRSRTTEPIEFVEVIPETGAERFPGMAPAKLPRESVREFAFADTVANKIAVKRREVGDKITTSQYLPVLEFADWCVEQRNEAPAALRVAEEMYRLTGTVADNDPAPRLGLALCYEAGFRFEDAYREYVALLEGGYDAHARVHARLGALEARLRLFESAERRFAEAERRERTAFEVQWEKGRFLLERRRFAEAQAALELAHKHEPGAEHRSARVGIRLDLAAARIAQGLVAGPGGAQGMYQAVLQAEPGQPRGVAGLTSVAYLLGAGAEGGEALAALADVTAQDVGFELRLAGGLRFMQVGQHAAARDALLAAAESDPLRAHAAWRALSWLAETAGYPVEAQFWIERAYEADPTDPYTLYQLGRVRMAADDAEGAEAAFTAALDQELDFAEALCAMGEIQRMRGDHQSAERYYERAVGLDAQRAELHARRGFNLLGLGDVRGAKASFDAALALEPGSAAGRAGSAWCAYRSGESNEAIAQLANLDDQRRAEPETDPWRVFAREQMERITEHEKKEAWTDRFERKRLGMQWEVEEAAGPIFTLLDGAVQLDGSFKESGGQARILRRYNAPLFVSIEMDVTLDPPTKLVPAPPATKARVSVIVSKERASRQGKPQVQGQISVGRHPEGGLQVEIEDKRSGGEPVRVDVGPVGGVPWWPAGKPVRLRIERVGEGSDSTGRISVDGIPVREGFSMRGMVTPGEVYVGLAAEGDLGRPVRLTIDNVEVVYQR
jgi:tetratricopeptide (TPR) repeat protein